MATILRLRAQLASTQTKIGDRTRGHQRLSTCDNPVMDHRDGPSFGAMIALVAVVVATVILVFFAIGYGIGRIFL